MPECGKCGGAASLRCGRCTVFYCSVECQKAAWPSHKNECAERAKAVAAGGLKLRSRPPRMIISPRLLPLRTGGARPTGLEEVAALSRLLLAVPWGGRGNPVPPFKQLRGEATTWSEAYEARYASEPHFREQLDRVLADDRGMDTPAAAGIDVAGIQWVGFVSMIDPELLAATFGSRTPVLCWRCAAQVSPPLSRTCSKCKRATFCSHECEEAASWWHTRAEGGCGCRR